MTLQKFLFVVVSVIQTVTSLNTNDQVGADIDYGSFQNPSNRVRPRFRYWVPDASVDLDTVKSDIIAASSVGAGGVELLGYYFYGAAIAGDIPVDWTLYGWGTAAWKNVLDAALQTSKDANLLLDFPLGPNQGAGVPAPSDSDGLLWELLPYNVSIPLGSSYNDVVPGWGSGDLVSASVGLVLESVNTTLIDKANFAQTPVPGNKTSLATSSLQDVTDDVDSQGRLVHEFPPSDQGTEYRLFAYYQVRTGYHETPSPDDLGLSSVPQSPVQSYVQNGSWLVDHFSFKGAQVITDFWEQYLFPNGTQELLQAVGNYGWEDSQEYGQAVTVWWTPQLLQNFSTSRAYDLKKFLPLIFYGNNGIDGALFSRELFVTDEVDGGMRHVDDYRQTLTELNVDYLNVLTAWCRDKLDSQFSAQVGYNLDMDMLANIPYVNAPETESLGFNHLIDGYRQYSGPANLAGKRVVSSELGAELGQAYQQDISEIVWNVQRSVVGSVNQFIFHGLPFSGTYPGCTWPGFTTFAHQFSEMHGPHQPGWNYYSDFMNWTARMQWIAQSGTPKFDIAFWLKNETWETIDIKYMPEDLTAAGYTYQYLSPDNFQLPNAVVKDNVLAPDAQAFKALVVRGNDTVTPQGIDQLLNLAHAGLPIVFSGGVPDTLFGFNESAAQSLNSTLQSIQSLPNVHAVPYDSLADNLQKLNINPRASPQLTKVDSGATLYTYWRNDPSNKVDYVIVYNDATGLAPGTGSVSGNITLDTSGTPWQYNSWTGDVAPIFIYSQDKGTTTVPISLSGNQSTIFAFQDTPQQAHFTSASPSIFSVSPCPNNSSLFVKTIPSSDVPQLTFQNGTSYTPFCPTTQALNLSTWNLTLESWSPPLDLTTLPSVLQNTTYPATALLPWSDISPNLQNVSGRGVYSSTFDVPATFKLSSSGGAALTLPPISHTLRASLNGHDLPVFDIWHPVAEITDLLVAPDGDGISKGNRLELVVSTPLGNAARGVWSELQCGGLSAEGPLPGIAQYGIIGSVEVVPLGVSLVDLSTQEV